MIQRNYSSGELRCMMRVESHFTNHRDLKARKNFFHQFFNSLARPLSNPSTNHGSRFSVSVLVFLGNRLFISFLFFVL
ncbi:hypothetical protein BDV23DRAFT_158407 [Aspergillus alliaceus]|uniref:Uncharacterized protein n=1 Tax=Petromyces alliaceus TaxID=209559 RepID=A0A5N7C3V8_PETAA|nr:hypothetical protein BDV23DRAFT_158407 [Aspergillus alliaceus]